MWITVAKWLSLIVVGFVLVMGSMIWYGKKVDAAYAKGFQDGENSVLSKLKQDGIDKANEDMRLAQERLKEKQEFDLKVNSLEKRLETERAKKPKNPDCAPTPTESDILRHAAEGNFS